METTIVALIQTLKRSNKKCGKEEVLRSVQESVNSEVTKEHFKKLLDELIKCNSVQTKVVRTQACMSLPKRAQYSKSHEQCNTDSVIEEFHALKFSFLTEVDSVKKKSSNSDGNDNDVVAIKQQIKCITAYFLTIKKYNKIPPMKNSY